MRKYSILLVAVALLVLASPAMAGTITSTLGAAGKAVQENFSDLYANRLIDGTEKAYGSAYDGIYYGNQAAFSESLNAMTVVDSTLPGDDTFETIQKPFNTTNPLVLQAPGHEYDGLFAADIPAYGIHKGMAGMAASSSGSYDIGNVGGGVVSVLFDMDQKIVGFDTLQAELDGYLTAEVIVELFDATGGHVGTTSFMPYDDTDPGMPMVMNTTWTIESDTFFRGMSISNTDKHGLLYDNFRYDVPVPEPTSIALFGLGIAGVAAHRRRRKAKQA